MPLRWILARLPKCFLSRGALLPLRSPPLWAASIWPLSNLHVYRIIISPLHSSTSSVAAAASFFTCPPSRARCQIGLAPSLVPPEAHEQKLHCGAVGVGAGGGGARPVILMAVWNLQGDHNSGLMKIKTLLAKRQAFRW